MSLKFQTILMVFSLVLLTSCATTGKQSMPASTDRTVRELLAPPPVIKDRDSGAIALGGKRPVDHVPPKPEINRGTGTFINEDAARKPIPSDSTEGEVVFNFENQPIQAVVKAILGDLLQENYTIAPNVSGNVTFSTSKPIKAEQARGILEMLLSWTGNTLVQKDGRYIVLQIKDAVPGNLTPRIAPPNLAKGYEVRVFPLKYVSATEMAKLLKPYAKADAVINADAARSMMVMAGTASELDNYQRTIDVFDVDWLKGMSIGVYTLERVEVTKLMPELEKIFGSTGESPLAGMFRFIPIERVNAVAIITPQADYLKQVEEWLHRLDQGGSESGTQLYVYDVKNVKAVDLANHLSEIFLGRATATSSRTSTSGSVAPGLTPAQIGGSGGGVGGNRSTSNRLGTSSMSSSTNRSAAYGAAPTTTNPAATGGGSSGSDKTDIRITPVEENNQLLVMATTAEWNSIQSAIKRLDVAPLQVQIEARILEVSLTGNLSYGIQWYLAGLVNSPTGSPDAGYGRPHERHQVGIAPTGSVGPTKNGFFYTYLNHDYQVAINALETSAVARTLSAPSLVVLNNQAANISVGKQIPINSYSISPYVGGTTGTTTTTNTSNYNALAQSQYVSTGVILNIKPRVNPGGLVYMEVSQEVSSPGDVGVNGNPQINSRQIETQIAVQSGETVLLGGLISENNNTSNNGVPGLSRIPILGSLFGNTTRLRDRTELIVLITPQVVANSDEARQLTEDYQSKFESLAPMRAQMHPITPVPKPMTPEVQPQPPKPTPSDVPQQPKSMAPDVQTEQPMLIPADPLL